MLEGDRWPVAGCGTQKRLFSAKDFFLPGESVGVWGERARICSSSSHEHDNCIEVHGVRLRGHCNQVKEDIIDGESRNTTGRKENMPDVYVLNAYLGRNVFDRLASSERLVENLRRNRFLLLHGQLLHFHL